MWGGIEDECGDQCGDSFTVVALLLYHIYNFVKEGLFDQVRVDHGKEFVITLYMHQILAHHRRNPNRDPHHQTESKKVMTFLKNVCQPGCIARFCFCCYRTSRYFM